MLERLAPVLVTVLLIFLWEGLVHLLDVDPFVLPAPSAILAALAAKGDSLLQAFLYTLRVTWIALGLALLSGVGLAFLIHRSRLAEAAILPIAVVLQVTPIVAIAPVILIWTGVEEPARALVIIAWIVAFFPVLSGLLSALHTIDPALRDLFRLYGAGPWDTLWRLELPAALPALLSSLKVASGLALIGAVVAEFAAGSGTSQGLAWRLIEAGLRLEVDTMFACLVLLSGMGLAQYALLGWVERLVLRRRGLLRP